MFKRVSLGLMIGILTAPVMAADVPPPKPAASTGTREPIQFTATPLTDCISYLTDISGINIVVDWKALDAANIARDTPITLHLASNVSLGKVLKLTLQQAAGAGVLTSYVDEGVLNITTQVAEDKLMITRVYPISDLLFQPTDYTGAPDLSITNVQSQSAGGGGGGGAGQSNLFSGGNNNQNSADVPTQADRANNIIKMITDTVRPELWKINGGDATIEFFRGNLVVHAPRSVHRQLATQYVALGK